MNFGPDCLKSIGRTLPIRPRPLSIIATTRPPITALIILPRPPNRLTPPMTAAPTASSSVSLPPVCGPTELSCEARAMPATPATMPAHDEALISTRRR